MDTLPLIFDSVLSRPRFSSGIGGLGVLVRAGLVKPVSLVKSAVEAMLILLVMERLRAGTKVCVGSSIISSSDWAIIARVSKEDLRFGCGTALL